MKKQEQPWVTEFVAVILGLMLVFYLALIFLAGVDYAAGLELIFTILLGIGLLMLVGVGLAALRGDEPRKIFILYDGQDARFVSKLYDALKVAPVRILWDKKEVQVGDNVEEKLKELFDSSSDVIFVLSRHSTGAAWTEQAIAKAIKKNKRIFPVSIDDAEPPEALQGIKAADFRLSFDDGYLSLREALRQPRVEPAEAAAAHKPRREAEADAQPAAESDE
jgi:hypothetical protein